MRDIVSAEITYCIYDPCYKILALSCNRDFCLEEWICIQCICMCFQMGNDILE